MKNLVVLVFILVGFNMYSQDKEQNLLVDNGIAKRIIRGFEYKNDSLVKQTYLVDELDEFGTALSFKTNDLNGTVVRESNYKFSEDGTTEYGEMRDENGNLKYYMVTIKDKEKRSIRKMQINAKHDTLVEQIWIKDKNLNDSILYRVRNGKRILSRKWNFNQGNVMTSEEYYDKQGDFVGSQSYTYKKNGDCIKRRNDRNTLVMHKCVEGNKEIRHLLNNREGYRSGITLVSEKGGKRVKTTLDNGLEEKVEYFSKKGKLLAKIEYTYEKAD